LFSSVQQPEWKVVRRLTKWEYMVMSLPTDEKELYESEQERRLNMQGKEGWELISIVMLQFGNEFNLMAYLKREKK
jgi:hypothetical protein